MGTHRAIRAAGIGNTEIQTQSGITAYREAGSNTLDGNLGTYTYVTSNADEHEYRFNAGTQKLKGTEITLAVYQGEGWPSDSNLDWYYIPPGETNPANYIWFGNYNYLGMVDLTDEVVIKMVISNTGWVFADGVYILFDQTNVEGGWGRIQEFKAYITMG